MCLEFSPLFDANCPCLIWHAFHHLIIMKIIMLKSQSKYAISPPYSHTVQQRPIVKSSSCSPVVFFTIEWFESACKQAKGFLSPSEFGLVFCCLGLVDYGRVPSELLLYSSVFWQKKEKISNVVLSFSRYVSSEATTNSATTTKRTTTASNFNKYYFDSDQTQQQPPNLKKTNKFIPNVMISVIFVSSSV